MIRLGQGCLTLWIWNGFYYSYPHQVEILNSFRLFLGIFFALLPLQFFLNAIARFWWPFLHRLPAFLGILVSTIPYLIFSQLEESSQNQQKNDIKINKKISKKLQFCCLKAIFLIRSNKNSIRGMGMFWCFKFYLLLWKFNNFVVF